MTQFSSPWLEEWQRKVDFVQSSYLQFCSSVRLTSLFCKTFLNENCKSALPPGKGEKKNLKYKEKQDMT